MGWLQYHQEIAKRFPHILKQVICQESIREEPFSIGGIERSVLITHLIEYYLPYKEGQGKNYTLLMGLVDNFPLNTNSSSPNPTHTPSTPIGGHIERLPSQI